MYNPLSSSYMPMDFLFSGILGFLLTALLTYLQTAYHSLISDQVKTKDILIYSPIIHLRTRGVYTYKFFQACPVKNCRLVFDKDEANRSDAVLFHTWIIPQIGQVPTFKRPPGQIWIMDQHEPPPVYYDLINVSEAGSNAGIQSLG